MSSPSLEMYEGFLEFCLKDMLGDQLVLTGSKAEGLEGSSQLSGDMDIMIPVFSVILQQGHTLQDHILPIPGKPGFVWLQSIEGDGIDLPTAVKKIEGKERDGKERYMYKASGLMHKLWQEKLPGTERLLKIMSSVCDIKEPFEPERLRPAVTGYTMRWEHVTHRLGQLAMKNDMTFDFKCLWERFQEKMIKKAEHSTEESEKMMMMCGEALPQRTINYMEGFLMSLTKLLYQDIWGCFPRESIENQERTSPVLSKHLKVDEKYVYNDTVCQTESNDSQPFKSASNTKQMKNNDNNTGSFDYELDMIDIVPSISVIGSWPDQANEWITRKRQWPNSETVNHIMQAGFHLVCKTSPGGDPDLDYRLSFSGAELKLARSMTMIQKEIFIAVKDIYHEAFQKPKVLYSYYLKTVFLWALERIPPSKWVWVYFGERVLNILDDVIHCLALRCIPHYFIPQLNLIDGVPVHDVIAITRQVIEVRQNPLKYPQQGRTHNSTKSDMAWFNLHGDNYALIKSLYDKTIRECCFTGPLGKCFQEVLETWTYIYDEDMDKSHHFAMRWRVVSCMQEVYGLFDSGVQDLSDYDAIVSCHMDIVDDDIQQADEHDPVDIKAEVLLKMSKQFIMHHTREHLASLDDTSTKIHSTDQTDQVKPEDGELDLNDVLSGHEMLLLRTLTQIQRENPEVPQEGLMIVAMQQVLQKLGFSSDTNEKEAYDDDDDDDDYDDEISFYMT